jgi:hypothetical protein
VSAPTLSREEVVAAVKTVTAVADAIKELGSVPSGHLYARVMGHLSLSSYTAVLDVLTRAGCISISNNVITWKG